MEQIQAKDLRAGNYLYYKNRPIIISGRDIWQIELKEKGSNSAKKHGFLKPIPLSPEILEKAGFEGSESEYGGWVSPFVNDQAIRLRINSEGIFYYSMTKYSNPIYIKSVHQLQNLYFALTGTELPLNL